jgi:hypothetical protein
VTPDSSPKTVASFRGKPAAVATVPGREDATFEFSSETKPAGGPSQAASTRTSPVVVKVKNTAMIVLGVVVGAIVVAGGVWAAMALPPAQPVGSLNVESDPPGAEVRVDDMVRGTTPLTVTVP